MSPIFVPKPGPQDWKHLLGDPESNWRVSFFSQSLAHCWEESDGFPAEVRRLFLQSGIPLFRNVEFLLAVPGHRVCQPGGPCPSEKDIFVLAKAEGTLISMIVEGKISEPFGPTLAAWNQAKSAGRNQRLRFLAKQLELPQNIPSYIRYDLLNRAASAVVEARRFNARIAVMFVHSFGENEEVVRDYEAFMELLGVRAGMNQLVFAKRTQGVDLYCGWAKGDLEQLRI